jgi:hypothetical protein
LNSHGFLGANKKGGDATAAVAKIKSSFDATLSTSSISNNELNVTTTFKNLTAHMFPGAHPMRRVLTRVIVTDSSGNEVNTTAATGLSTFAAIDNTTGTLTGKTLHSSAGTTVTVPNSNSANLDFPDKVADLNGSAVVSQDFNGTTVTYMNAPDSTITAQSITADGNTTGSLYNAAITTSSDASNFTRIYGHETGKIVDGAFVVRPGFDSNVVASDSRLSPNETETYTLSYDVTGLTGDLTVTYKVYYMQKGANGKFDLTNASLLITEVGTKTETVTIP